MRGYKDILCQRILFLILISLISCVSNKDARDSIYEKVSILDSSSSYDQIIKELRSYNWEKEKDPAMLMIYCDALVERGKDLPDNMPSHVTEFAQGFISLKNGRFGDALTKFVKLTENENKRFWGYIGLLEYSLYTQRLNEVSELLKSLQFAQVSSPEAVPDWAPVYYAAWYYFHSGKYEQLNKLIEERRDILDPVSLYMLKTHLLIRNDKFDEAKKVLSELPQEFLNDPNVISIESEIIKLQYGIERQLAYLKEKQDKLSHIWNINQLYANVLIEAGQSQKGIAILKEISEKRPFDIMLQLDLYENILLFGQKEETEKIYEQLFSKPLKIPSYFILLAKIYDGQGMYDEALVSLSRAKELNSKHPHVLWLIFNISIDIKNYERASQVINEIVELYPNDVSTMVAKMNLNYLQDEWKKFDDAERQLNRSNRFIDEDARDMASYYKALAMAKQGRYDESNDALQVIKDSAMRNRASTEIKKIKNN